MKTSVKKLIFVLFSLFIAISVQAQAGKVIFFSGRILSAQTQAPLESATLQLYSEKGAFFGTVTDAKGIFRVKIPTGKYRVIVSYIGYHSLTRNTELVRNDSVTFRLALSNENLEEVIVTATEAKGSSSATKIDREAMQHRQPTSFGDLLSLLPGGMSAVPAIGSASLIALRQAGTAGEDYDISSLGTAFLVDGHRLATDANMQKVVQISGSSKDSHSALEFANRGIDMRSLSTDQIESVEIVRGLASVEYGDLTSGLVKINRKKGFTPWEARFKADQYGKLFALGKGIELKDRRLSLNAGLDHTDARPDPRDAFSSYKRLTVSIRLNKQWNTTGYRLSWGMSGDYTGSFDDRKSDPEITKQKEDRYKASYNALSLGNTLRADYNHNQTLKFLELTTSLSFQTDKIKQTKVVQLDRDRTVPNSLEAGEHDGLFLPYKYTAHLLVDGKPFRAAAKLKAGLSFSGQRITHRVLLGTEWSMDKNYGRGQVYDINRPLNPTTSLRPTSFVEIPAGHKLSLFAEDNINLPFGPHLFRVTAGVRGQMQMNLNRHYLLQNKMYFDPRISAQWHFPAIGPQINLILSGGIGRQTKMPTLQQLHPYKIYHDIIQLNYYHLNPEYRRINIRTYLIDPTNYNLKPARNRKWEIKADFSYAGNNLVITYFQETMHSGFRSSTEVAPYSYKKYNTGNIDPNTLQGPPDLADLQWQADTILQSYGQTTNGSSLLKKGIEFQLVFHRIEVLKTKLTVNGAWFHTTYKNSRPMYYSVSKVINNVALNDKYIGYYNWNDGYVKQQFNTTFILDTRLKQPGLTFSTWIECMWFSNSRRMRQNGIPTAYMDVTGNLHPYTEADRKDMYKKWLVREYNDELFKKTTEPFYMYLNFKASKDFGKYLNLSLFVDRILDYTPDYDSNGYTIRRNVTPYFGMELNFRL